jgi:hypothetical protein
MTENEIENEDVMTEFKENLKCYAEHWDNQYQHCEELELFWSGVQHTNGEISDRRINLRPELKTLNITRSYVNSVVNPFRMSPNGINVKIDDADASMVLNQVIHNIEEQSNASEAYEIAFENSVVGGVGWAVVTTDYESDESMDQTIKIQPIRNSSQVFLDPASKQIDGSDARNGMIIDYISKEVAEELYGEDVCHLANKKVSYYKHWLVPKDMIPVVTYYTKNEKQITRWFFKDGSYIDGSKPMLPFVGSRKVFKSEINVHKIVGETIIESTVLPIKYIPIVPFYGDRVQLGTNVRWTGLVNWMKPSQQLINTYFNTELEMLDDAPIAPYMATKEQIKGLESYYQRANKTKFATLLYNETGSGAPQRISKGIDVTPYASGRASAVADIQRATGIFDPIFGAGNAMGAESGIAIQNRNIQGEQQNIHYYQNAIGSIRQIGNIIVELIQFIFDEPRDIKIAIGDETKIVKLNIADILGKIKKSDIAMEVSVGAMLKSKKDNEEFAINQIVGLLPEDKKTAFIDIMASKIESKDSQIIRERLKKLIPIEFQETEQTNIDPMAQQALESANQALEGSNQQVEMMKQYITQLQNQMIEMENDQKLALAQTQLKNENALELQAMKEQGLNQRQLADMIQESNKRHEDQIAKVLSEMEKFKPIESYNLKDLKTDLDGKQG